jgi:hypothetical protein
MLNKTTFTCPYFQDYFPVLLKEWGDAYKTMRLQGGDICKEVLSSIVCPTMIIRGDKDNRISAEQTQYLENNIKNSR